MTDRPTPERLRELLKQLEDDVDAACVRACEAEPVINGAVNWADLHCAEAGYYENSHGDSGLYVVIEEAAPDQRDLAEFIRADLCGAGWEGLEIRFEW
jgi:hypothetical protein